ncbi:MAG: hypothetical protein PHS14_02955 [Elusimicrobia bacterium]|nr:hypothetical protein [Elusimicrobiota bacterium]
MSRKKKPEPLPEPRHGTTSESMVAWTCRCGGRWMNERMRKEGGVQKTDAELVIERDSAFLDHVREMERQGYA